MKKIVSLLIIICLLPINLYSASRDSSDVNQLLLRGEYDEIIRHVERKFERKEIIACREIAYAYLKSLVFTGNIRQAMAFHKEYSDRYAPDPEAAYLHKICRILEICGYYLKQKGLKKILAAHQLDPNIRDSLRDVIDFYQISMKYDSDSPIFRNNVNTVMAYTLKNSKNRIGLIEECLDQENIDLLNLGLECMNQEDAGLFKDKLIELAGIKGIHTTDILDLLKHQYKAEVLELAGHMLQNKNVSDFIKARVILGLKGLPYADIKPIVNPYIRSESMNLKSSAINLLRHYINSDHDALDIFINDLSTGYHPQLFSSYRKTVCSLDLPAFERLAASWSRLNPHIQDMMTVTALNHNGKIKAVNPILERSGALNGRLWYNILNQILPPEGAGAENKIIFLLSIDTLRRDHVNLYGYQRETMPLLSELVKKGGMVYDRVFANTSWTLPSHVSMLSGLSPEEHGVNETHRRIEPSMPYFPEFLKNHGFFTAAFVTSTLVSQQHHFERGFDFFYYNQEEKAADILEKVKILLYTLLNSGIGKPIFIFIHLYDCHSPYQPEDPFNVFHDAPPFHVPENGFIDEQQNLYDGEILYVDQTAGHFINHVRDRFGADFVITSDHGEEFLDHMGIHHGTTLYNEVVGVPFIIIAAREDTARLNLKKDSLFSIQETPFILSRLLGLGYQAGEPDAWKRGVELLLYRDELHKIGCIKENVKIIHDMSRNRFEAYDIIQDPGEKNNLGTARFPKEVKYLKQRAERLAPEGKRQESIDDEDMENRLRELGYLH